ncbi:MAG: DUF6635 family protein [Fibrobacterota bacterium]
MKFSYRTEVDYDIAYRRAVRVWASSRREKVPGFIKKNFSFGSALRLHRSVFGKDLYRVPLNIAVSIPVSVMSAAGYLMRKARLPGSSVVRKAIPPVLETTVQKKIKALIYKELLELPFSEEKEAGKDSLFEIFASSPEITEMISRDVGARLFASGLENSRRMLESNLAEYSSSRTAAEELAGNILTAAAGGAAAGSFTPGALAAGTALSSAISRSAASSNFFLGRSLGSFYYSVFSAAPSAGLVFSVTGAVMGVTAVVSSFSGIITDPIQAKLGIHKRRLLSFIDSAEAALLDSEESYKIREKYLSRIFDLADIIKTAAKV